MSKVILCRNYECKHCKPQPDDPRFTVCTQECIGISYRGTCLNFEYEKVSEDLRKEREHENTQ